MFGIMCIFVITLTFLLFLLVVIEIKEESLKHKLQKEAIEKLMKL